MGWVSSGGHNGEVSRHRGMSWTQLGYEWGDVMGQWQVLDLTQYEGVVAVDRGCLVLGEHRVPVADVGTVLVGQGARWGYGLVDKAVRFDFTVLVCDWRMVPIAHVSGWSDNSRVVARHRAQAAQTEPRRKNAWMRVIKRKIEHQARSLRECSCEGEASLLRLAKQVRSGDPSNVEAQAASLYWKQLFGSPFRRDPQRGDALNDFLNYGYTILRGAVIREVLAAGLSPSLTLFHRGRGNTFALADDLIEPFRPVVDVHVATHLSSELELTKDVRAGLVSVAQQPFTKDGSSVATAVRQLCQNYARYVEGDVEGLSVPKWGA